MRAEMNSNRDEISFRLKISFRCSVSFSHFPFLSESTHTILKMLLWSYAVKVPNGMQKLLAGKLAS